MKIPVHVKANARRSTVGGMAGGCLAVRVKEQAIDGKANAAVLEVVAQAFGLRTRHVHLVLGRTSPRKLLQIDIDEGLGATRLAELKGQPAGGG